MNDNEIIKALECCKDSRCSRGCPIYGKDIFGCTKTLSEQAIDLITRQKAEIERLKTEVNLLVENQSIPNGAEDEDWYTIPQLKSVDETKAEAIKEFAKMLIDEKSYSHPNELNTRIVYVSDIQEMVGDKE